MSGCIGRRGPRPQRVVAPQRFRGEMRSERDATQALITAVKDFDFCKRDKETRVQMWRFVMEACNALEALRNG